MLLRIWHGWTAPGDADDYERLLTGDILPDIAEEVGDGYRGHTVARDDDGDEVEFVTILRFDSMAAVESLVDGDPERAHVPDEARELLSRYDERVTHYEVRDEERT